PRLASTSTFRQAEHVVPIVDEAVQVAAARVAVGQLELDRPPFRETMCERQPYLARFRVHDEELVCGVLYERRAGPVELERPRRALGQPSCARPRQTERSDKG